MLHCNIDALAYLSPMSKPLAISAAFAIFATSALALFAPGSAMPSDMFAWSADTGLAAPGFSALVAGPR